MGAILEHVSLPERFHELLVDVSGRRLKDLWSMLNSQMGAVMRADLDRLGIGLLEAVEMHRGILEAVTAGDITRFHLEVRDHYLKGFPSPQGAAAEGRLNR